MKKKKVIVPNIVAGGTAVPLGSNYYLMRGRKHEEGGIDVGANPRTGLEVEDGEVMQLKDKEVRVFSTVPFLNGQSPAQKVMGGENPNKVFAQQEAYKDRNNINDDGTRKAKFGIEDSLEIGKVAASFLPIVGTGMDIYEAIKNPSLSTIGQAGLSLAADLTGLSLVKGAVKTARQVNRINKLRKEADAALAPIKHTMQSLVKTNNPKKIQRAREIRKDWADKYHEYGKALYDFRTRNRNINIAAPLYTTLEGANSVVNYNNIIEDDLQLLNNKKGYGGNHPLNTKYKQKQVIDMKNDNSRRKAKAGLRYILQTNGRNKLGYVSSTGESLSGAKGRVKAELDTRYEVDYSKIKSIPTDTLRYQYVVSNPKYKKQFSNWQTKIDSMSDEEVKAEFDKLLHQAQPTLENSLVDENRNARLIYGKVRNYANSDQAVYNVYAHNASYNDRMGYLLNKIKGRNYRIDSNTTSVPNNEEIKNTKLNAPNKNNNIVNIPKFGLTDINTPQFAINNSLPSQLDNVGVKPIVMNYEPVDSETTLIGNNVVDNISSVNIPSVSKPSEPVKPVETTYVNNAGVDDKKDKETKTPWATRALDWAKEHPNTIDDTADAVFKGGASLASYFINRNMLNKMSYNRQPVPRIAAKLKTNININPQLNKMRESLANYERNIDANTASSQVGLVRKQKARANSLSGYNELYGYKENAETELINKDRLNQQEVANQSIADYNSYIEKKMAFDNAVREKKAENVVSLVNNLASIPSDIITRTDKRRSDALNAALIMARNPNVTPEYLESLGIKLPGNKRKNNKKD